MNPKDEMDYGKSPKVLKEQLAQAAKLRSIVTMDDERAAGDEQRRLAKTDDRQQYLK